MRLKQVLTGVVGVAGVCLFGSLPAKATARLQTWQFDTGQNRLVFTTEGGVQPQVSWLTNPRRLVIDLPGILSETALGDQFVGGAVQAVRVTQVDAHTTRMVLELNPSYDLDPKQVKVWGLTSQQWVVQLPGATPAPPANDSIVIPDFSKAAVRPLTAVGDDPLPPRLSRNQVNTTAVRATATVLRGVQVTAEGFFIHSAGAIPQVQVYRTRDANQTRQLVIDVLDAAIVPGLAPDALPQGRYGIQSWSLTQFATAPPAVRITLSLEGYSPDWQITPLTSGGIWVTPIGVAPSQIAAPPTTVVLPVVQAAAPVPIGSSTAAPQPTLSPSVQQAAVPNRSQVLVMLDPGHGGVDPGAVGIGGLQEKGVVLAVAQHTAAALRAQGVAVQFTRQGDQTVDLQPRTEMADAARATVFVSIHANAVNMQRPEVNGLETYYYSDAGRVLATALQNHVLSVLPTHDRGVRQARFWVLRRTSMPAALIEIGFVTGATDAPKLRDPRWQAQMGQAIAQGILNYLQGQP
ncbi:N-acetylmuramoyl-L-alanine amidase [Nodosilinea sp. LEGE 07088]|uniref:N-acetylmuramoyl-L-alanine amidase n=1 Tax=Nodosilinea sp. LEGE 07088 TaxID=2777968 RepID=UPI001881EFA9|nr:N-acetylmuramoyl-L-alanine amidase [Nodosilinea sp. LEGE 07088]MBE9138327.1 N-acetylmuramoyl-L-alanine amidase [Nodosilinea sp. LEGE 07088]